MPDNRTRVEKLRAMAASKGSPYEAEIARQKLIAMGATPKPLSDQERAYRAQAADREARQRAWVAENRRKDREAAERDRQAREQEEWARAAEAASEEIERFRRERAGLGDDTPFWTGVFGGPTGSVLGGMPIFFGHDFAATRPPEPPAGARVKPEWSEQTYDEIRERLRAMSMEELIEMFRRAKR